jgi:hypothetical protein
LVGPVARFAEEAARDVVDLVELRLRLELDRLVPLVRPLEVELRVVPERDRLAVERLFEVPPARLRDVPPERLRDVPPERLRDVPPELLFVPPERLLVPARRVVPERDLPAVELARRVVPDPERLLDVERLVPDRDLVVEPERLREPDVPERERPLLRRVWRPPSVSEADDSSPPSSSSSPLPSSFLATPYAAVVATPSAAPVATFFPVDMPSSSGSTSIVNPPHERR